MDLIKLKIVLCRVKARIYYGPVVSEEYEVNMANSGGLTLNATEMEAGKGHCYTWGKILERSPETPKEISSKPVDIPDHLRKKLEQESSSEVEANHSLILNSLNSQVISYNKFKESEALAKYEPGEYTINFKYLREG